MNKPKTPTQRDQALKRAAIVIRRLKEQLADLEAEKATLAEPIAIVGIGCRFPGGADGPEAFWSLLEGGRDAIRSLDERWAQVGAPISEGAPGWAGLLTEAIDGFDPGFFGISPREAAKMDPQQRLLLEVVWEAIEDAGLPAPELDKSRTGVFLGASTTDYADSVDLEPEPERDAYSVTGSMLSVAAGRIAYTLGLQGPCLTVDTACSSSLVATHLACRSLREQESDLALAGGVNLLLSPTTMEALARTQALSPDGRCRAFDAGANGFVRGEGCGVVVLKRLADAKRDGDRVWAVIRGSAVNQDGRSTGLTAPNVLAQEALLREALSNAGVDAEAIGFVETHGTGTSLGDPIEIEALRAVIGAARPADAPCVLGALKTNVGHLEAAAGIAGLIKSALILAHAQIPRNLNFRTLNPRIRLEGTALALASTARPWPRGERPRCAGVSSFGLSGTNAHMILEEAPLAPASASRSPQAEAQAELFVLSAKTEPARDEQARRLCDHLLAHPELPLDGLARSLAISRTAMEHRLALAASSPEELRASLSEAAEGRTPTAASREQARTSGGKLGFLFTGQGAQLPGMGRGLHERWPAFAEAFDRAAERFDAELPRPLREIMWADPRSADADLLNRTDYTQPALFTLEYALFALWRSWGVSPDLMAGHSIGEIVAACAAGLFSLDDATRMVAARGRLMQALPPGGAMISIAASEQEVLPALQDHLDRLAIAAVNGPAQIVISGAADAAEEVAERFAARGVRTKALRVSHAFHSPAMEPMLEGFRRVVETIRFNTPSIPLVGALDGHVDAGAMASADYWVRHVRHAVRFADGIATLHDAGVDTFLELGPTATLLGLVAASLNDDDAEPSLHASLRRGRDEATSVLSALGSLWCRGQRVDWRALSPEAPRVHVPTYAWQRQSFWVEVDRSAAAALGEPGAWPLSGLRVATPDSVVHHVLRIGAGLQPYLSDHRIFGRIVVPGAFHLTALLAVAAERWPEQALELRNVEFLRALPLEDDEEIELHVLLRDDPLGGPTGHFELASQGAAPDRRWTTHVRGQIQTIDTPPGSLAALDELRQETRQEASVDAFLDGLRAHNIDWGPTWRRIERALASDTRALAELAPSSAADAPLHPCLLDNSFGATTFCASAREAEDSVPRLPFAIDRLRWWRPAGGPIRCGVIAHPAQESADVSMSDVVLWDERGEIVAEVERFVSRRAPRAAFFRQRIAPSERLYQLVWREESDAYPGEDRAPSQERWIVVGEPGSDRAATLAAALPSSSRAAVSELDAALESEPAAAGVLCVWEPREGEPVPQAGLRLASEALSLLNTLHDHPRPPKRTVWITTMAVCAAADEPTSPAAATLWGLGRTALQERPELGLTMIDLGREAPLEALLRELAADTPEPQIALRSDKRLVARLHRAGSGAEKEKEKGAPPPLDRGTVLITGGLGAIGRHVAAWLAERGAELLLVGRSGDQDPDAQAFVRDLRELGASVAVAAVDVADRSAVQELLHALPEDRPLRGVIHAAGALGDGLLGEQDGERFARVFAAKVTGAWNLHELTAELELDFFLLFSSTAGLLGSAGQSNYAAANTFLDALAGHRRSRGLPAQSLAWGPWATEGMAAELGQPLRERLTRLGLSALDPLDALALLDAGLTHGQAQLALALLDPERASQSQGAAPLWRDLLARPTRAATSAPARWTDRLVGLTPEQRRKELLKGVQEEVAKVLAIADAMSVPTDKPLMELGLDSLMAVELRNDLGRRIGASLPATLAFDHPTVAALAERLADELPTSAEPGPLPGAAELGPPSAESADAGSDAYADAYANDADAIAIVGIGCRFPGGIDDPESFWRLLEENVDAIREVPADRWPIDEFYDPDPNTPGKMTTRWGGFLSDIDRFEPEFFGISPREAPSIDPQQRLLLETSWDALDRAGQTPEGLMGSDTGVYVGICGNEYQAMAISDVDAIDAYSLLGTSHSASVGRLSYWLGLKGPNVPVDTACSSSLVAVHLACQALRAGECSLALAGGVNVLLAPAVTVYFSRLRAMSPTGRCHAFSDAADGYVRSEGCGLVVLKRLADARRDGDRIVAVIRGSAINQDGRSSGLTAPNGPSQEAVIRRALADAKVSPEHVGYLEAHGTGTPLGDPIEVQAIAAALGQGRPADAPLVIGSVKSNIGHAEGAAGIAGLIKAALCLQHRTIPRSLHCGSPNSLVDWSALPVRVAAEARSFRPAPGGGRYAGVSSFGFSGTNTHVVLTEAPAAAEHPHAPQRPAHAFVLSAKGPEALRQQAARLRAHLDHADACDLGDLAFSLATRATMEHRLVIVAESVETLSASLDAAAEGREVAGITRGRAATVPRERALLFTGQGSQTPGMGRALHATWPAFAEAFDRAAELFDGELERPLKEIMWSEPGSPEASLLDRTDYTQPALFVFELALASLWRAWGLEPDLLAGHSIGEIAAACLAGVFSIEDAASLVAARGRLMQALPAGGGMAAIATTEAEALSVLAPYASELSLAAINGPAQVVLSGALGPLAEVVKTFEERDISTKLLRVSHAFHSPLMAPMLEEFRRVAESITYRPPRLPIVSTLLGRLCDDTIATADYWVRHVREAVRFADAARALHAAGARTFLEIGPRATLLSHVAETLTSSDLTLQASVHPREGEVRSVLTALSGLFCGGARIDWRAFFEGKGRRVPLPAYPWQRQRYWLDAPRARRLPRTGHPLLGEARIPANRGTLRIWETSLELERLPWLADHQVQGQVIFPGAAYLEMALAAGTEVFGRAPRVRDVAFIEALSLVKDAVDLQVVTTEDIPGRLRFQIASRTAGSTADDWITHAHGELTADDDDGPAPIDPEELRARLTEHIPHGETYATMERTGLMYGPSFRGLIESWRAPKEAFGRVRLPDAAGGGGDYGLHPALLDACFHVMTGAFPEDPDARHTWLPVGVGSMRLHHRPTGEVLCHVHGVVEEDDAGALSRRVQISLYRPDGTPVAELRDFRVQSLSRAQGLDERWFLEPVWAPSELPAPTDRAGGRVVLLGDGHALGEALSAALDPDGSVVAAATPLELTDLLKSAGPPVTAVVYLSGLKEPEPGAPRDPAALWEASCAAVDGLLHTAQALADAEGAPPRLLVVTRGAQPTPGADIAYEEAPLLGLARTVRAEHPELRCACVDLDPRSKSVIDDARTLVQELSAEDEESELRWRSGQREASRIVHASAEVDEPVEPAADRSYRLEIDVPGMLDQLVLRTFERRRPGPGEVEITVEAAALNFIDVMKAMGIYPGLGDGPIALGGECSGTISALGAGVEDLQLGQAVVAMAPHSFASHVIARAHAVTPRPATLSAGEAAAVPAVFMTAWYGLVHLAGVRPGERVLIHSATGGTGLAAIQIARHLGAEIFATAGTEEKRAWLREQGIRHTMDSRSTDFADQILEITDGEGIDVVLNSLSGAAIEANMACLAYDGRFIEIGKTDIYSDRALSLAPFKKSITLSAVDLAGFAERRPRRLAALFKEVMDAFATGTLQPPLVELFPIERASDAFHKMAQAKHRGKLVLQAGSTTTPVRAPQRVTIRGDRSYLIVGGLGGLGLSLARWLGQRGAGRVVLMGRSGVVQAHQREALDALASSGAQITVARGDVASQADLEGVLKLIADTGEPLAGVFHLAGLLDDGLLAQQSADRLRAVMAPKVRGTLLLDALTRAMPLDLFVLYASVAGLFGSAGQSGYSAANAFLDAFAHHRRALGRPALSVDWGAFADVGMAAADGNRGARLAARGLGSIRAQEGLLALERLLQRGETQAAVIPIDPHAWAESDRAAASSPRLAALFADADPRGGDDLSQSLLQRVANASPEDKRHILDSFLREVAAKVLRIAIEKIDPDALLTNVGFDSLMGLELKQRLERDIAVSIPVARLLRDSSLTTIAAHILEHLPEPSDVATAESEAEAAADDDWADFEI